MKRTIFMISDGTGITVENFANSLMSQFANVNFEKVIIPYVDCVEKAENVVKQINSYHEDSGLKPIVFVTLIEPNLVNVIKQSHGAVFDIFNNYIGPLEKELNIKSSHTVGRTHGVINTNTYTKRIEAIEYALGHDDGLKVKEYDRADIILLGVSRCGKTPSCLYMALHFGVLAANYPITDEDLGGHGLPDCLKPYKNKLFGLTIECERLQQIRHVRRPNSPYSALDQCRREVGEVQAMYERGNIPYINSTQYSIEEIATKVLNIMGIKRKF